MNANSCCNGSMSLNMSNMGAGNNMKITICIGSSCHLKGSRQVVEQLQAKISDHGLKEQVDLAGTFCMENCQKGVSVTMDGKIYSLTPETTAAFFENEVLPRTCVSR